MMTRSAAALSGLLALALLPGAAGAAERITTRADFLRIVERHRLTALGVTMIVGADGRLSGRAFGRAVHGRWEWQSGWFCRTMSWGSRDFPLNCQLVTRDGDRIGFTADKGAGDSATLTLR